MGWRHASPDRRRRGQSPVIERDPSDPARAVIRGESEIGVEWNPINGMFHFPIDRKRFHLDIDLGAGNDTILIFGLKKLSNLKIRTGTGDDRIEIVASRFAGEVRIDAQGGSDAVSLRKTDLFGPSRIQGGSNRDRFELAQVHARKRVEIRDDHGASGVTIGTSSFDRAVEVRTDDIPDNVFIDSCTFKSAASIRTRAGDDHVKIRNTVFRAEPEIDDGNGDDTLDRELLLSWDFGDGLQGWESGFADYDDTILPDGSSNLDGYKLRTGLEPLPEAAAYGRRALLLSGQNRSDDLFMYMSRKLSRVEGLIPGAAYILSFNVRFASNVPAGLVGAGGPPAEAVYIKMGGISAKPELIEDKEQAGLTVIKNLDKRGTTRDTSTAGNIRNGDDPDAPGAREYKIVVRSVRHPHPIATAPDGALWLIVGTDSGFEGITTLYYTSVTVRLTPVDS